MFQKIKIPLLLLLAVVVILAMLRLAVWQLERAEQKQVLLDQVTERSQQQKLAINALLADFNRDALRYRPVSVTGSYRNNDSIYIDNQVVSGQVGYLVFTPFDIAESDYSIVVNRGWLPAGLSRAVLPKIPLEEGTLTLNGRLNEAPKQPPLWNEQYTVSQGDVWAYLPLDRYASQIELKLLPLVLELAPKQVSTGHRVSELHDTPIIKWAEINDQWVAKHQGYAFQWLMMALAFLIACLVLLFRHLKAKKTS